MSNSDRWCQLYKTFPGLLKESKACENTSLISFHFYLTCVQSNFEGELVISPYAQYFLQKKESACVPSDIDLLRSAHSNKP